MTKTDKDCDKELDRQVSADCNKQMGKHANGRTEIPIQAATNRWKDRQGQAGGHARPKLMTSPTSVTRKFVFVYFLFSCTDMQGTNKMCTSATTNGSPYFQFESS